MRTFHLALVAGASLLLALSGAANAHPGSGGGGGGLGGGSGGGAPSSPPGFSSGGGHGGFDSNSTGSQLSESPKGWDQGKADWKTGSPDSTTSPDTALPPGFSKH